MEKAVLFHIQRFCLQDGPGVRTTVFLKGCPLSCLWCHNPESQKSGPELLFDRSKCTSCGRCVSVCPHEANYINEKKRLEYQRQVCMCCGVCADHCPTDAREFIGKEYTVSQCLNEIKKDRPFYEQSGGGVTFSGGEPLLYADFVYETAKACRDSGISVAVDTSGFAPFKTLERIASVTNVFLYDIKHMDPNVHRKLTGVDNKLILENLKKLSKLGNQIHLRLPLVEGINSDDNEIQTVLTGIDGLSIQKIHLLPYHQIGRGKYEKLGRTYAGEAFVPPSERRLNKIQKAIEKHGYRVVIGG